MDAAPEATPGLKSAQAEIAEHGDLLPKDDKMRTVLWGILLLGLFAVAGLALWISYQLAISRKPEIAAFTALAGSAVTGTLGLFAPSPVQRLASSS